MMTDEEIQKAIADEKANVAALIADCGFANGIDFKGVDEWLRRKILNVMSQWRWDTNQRKFENRHRPRKCPGGKCKR